MKPAGPLRTADAASPIAATDPASVARFAAVGAVAIGLHYALLVALVELGAAGAVAGTTLGFLAGAAFSFLANRRWTFGTGLSQPDAARRGGAMAGAGLALNAALVWALHVAVGAPYLLAQVAATGACFAVNHAVASRWAYAPARARPRRR